MSFTLSQFSRNDFSEIPSFPMYFVSRTGVVINSREMILSGYENNGYRAISLKNKEGRRVGVAIHRLVAETYIGPIPKGRWINHKNGIKSDNRVENLEITTPTENHIHARDVLKRSYSNGSNYSKAALDDDTVRAIRQLHTSGWSQRQLAKLFLVSQPCICNIVNGKNWKHVKPFCNSTNSSTPSTKLQ